MNDLYIAIEGLCAEQGITIGKMCKAAGISQSKITDLKNGRRNTVTLPTAKRIAAALNVPVLFLIGEKKEAATPAITAREAAIAYFIAEKGREPSEKELDMFVRMTKPVLDSLPDKAD